MIIDSHAHLMMENFDHDFLNVLANAKAIDVVKIVNVAFDRASSEKSVEMAQQYDVLYGTLGIDSFVSEMPDLELFAMWRNLINNNNKIVGIGECGLDYFRSEISKKIQYEKFEKMADFAVNVGLPLIVHNRESDEDVLSILDNVNSGVKKINVVFHCFTQNLVLAQKVWSRGYFTSFSGILTFPSAKELQEVAINAPLDRILIETDSPFLAPQNMRGERNEPSNVKEVLAKLVELKNIDRALLEEEIYKNTIKVFNRMA